jgi:glyoxylase-like metal-dependent hydrolase (beta-lactamase superfamily II)
MSEKNIIQLTVGANGTNCWIYKLNKTDAAIIDPGDEAQRIISVLENISLVPKYILLTHGHFDHIAAVPELAAAFKTRNPQTCDPQIAIHRLDCEYLGDGAYNAHSVSMKAAMGDTSFVDALWNDMPPPDRLIEEGDVIGPFTVLHLPGHTQGSAAFWDKEGGILFTGDTLFRGDWGRTDLPGGDEDAIFASLRRLLAMDANIKVYPGHGNTTTIGREASLI